MVSPLLAQFSVPISTQNKVSMPDHQLVAALFPYSQAYAASLLAVLVLSLLPLPCAAIAYDEAPDPSNWFQWGGRTDKGSWTQYLTCGSGGLYINQFALLSEHSGGADCTCISLIEPICNDGTSLGTAINGAGFGFLSIFSAEQNPTSSAVGWSSVYLSSGHSINNFLGVGDDGGDGDSFSCSPGYLVTGIRGLLSQSVVRSLMFECQPPTPTFTMLQWCATVNGQCNSGWSTLFTPTPTQTMGTQGIAIQHEQLQQYAAVQFYVTNWNPIFASSSNSDTDNEYSFHTAPAILSTKCSISSSWDDCQQLDLRTLATTGPLTLTFTVSSNAKVATGMSTTWSVDIQLVRSDISTLSALSVSAWPIAPVFTQSQHTYSVYLPRVTTYAVFSLTYTHTEEFAASSLTCFPALTQSVDVTVTPYTLTQALFPNNQVPFGNTICNIAVTSDSHTSTTVYTITIMKPRNHVAVISSMLASYGNLTPPHSRNTLAYSLLAHLSDTSTPIRVLISLQDSFSHLTARWYPAGEANIFSSLGYNLTVLPAGTVCSAYQYMVQYDASYGPSVLALMVTADDGLLYNITTISITKVSFNLLSLTSSYGSLQPAFQPLHSAYSLVLSNAQSFTDLRAIRVDRSTTLSWSLQTVDSRRGPEPVGMLPDAPVDARNTTWSQTLSLSKLPLGRASVALTLHTTDGYRNTYTLAIRRMIDPLNQITGVDALILSGSQVAGMLNPTFDPLHTAYELDVDSGVDSIVLRVITTFSDLTLTLQSMWRGARALTVRSSSSTGARYMLLSGITTTPTMLTVQVVNALGDVLQTYTFAVSQRLASNADLYRLTFSSGTLVPAFAYDEQQYELSLQWPEDLISDMPALIVVAAPQLVTATLTAWYQRSQTTMQELPVISTQLNGSAVFITDISAANMSVGMSTLALRTAAADGITFMWYNVTLNMQLLKITPPTVSQLAWADVLQVVLSLQLDASSITDPAALREQLAYDLSIALGVSLVRIVVTKIQAGSIKCTLLLQPDTSSSLSSAMSLWQKLAAELSILPSGPLADGLITRYLDANASYALVAGCMTANGDFVPVQTDAVVEPMICQLMSSSSTGLKDLRAVDSSHAGSDSKWVVILSTILPSTLFIGLVVYYCYNKHRSTRPSHKQVVAPNASVLDVDVAVRVERRLPHVLPLSMPHAASHPLAPPINDEDQLKSEHSVQHFVITPNAEWKAQNDTSSQPPNSPISPSPHAMQ